MSSNSTNINYNDFKNICRTCLFNYNLKPLQDEVVIEVLNRIIGVDFKTNDDLPQQICVNCFEKIRQIQEFSSQCNEPQSSLLTCLNNFKNNQLNVKQEIVIETIEPINVKEEITIEEHKIEFDPDENFFNDLNLLTNQETNDTSNNQTNEYVIPETIVQNIEPNTSIHVENKSIEDSNSNSSENNDKKYKCDLCNKEFPQLISLKRHAIMHRKDPYKCDACAKTFLYSRLLERHNCSQSNFCDICNRDFNNLRTLKNHKITHSVECPFKCDQCPMSFTKPSNLKRHQFVHSGERPYKCDACARTFFYSRQLEEHKCAQSYVCNICNKDFNNPKILKNHKHTHSVECPFKCDQCPMSFTKSSDLKRHQFVHSGERPDI